MFDVRRVEIDDKSLTARDTLCIRLAVVHHLAMPVIKNQRMREDVISNAFNKCLMMSSVN